VWADALDEVTGTEGWNAPVKIDEHKLEWQDWYRCRVVWRRALRDLRLQRARNRRLARLLRGRGAPKPGQLMRAVIGPGRRGAAESRQEWVVGSERRPPAPPARRAVPAPQPEKKPPPPEPPPSSPIPPPVEEPSSVIEIE
jgi:hypothetical protein